MSLDDLKTANFFHIEPDSIFYKYFGDFESKSCSPVDANLVL
jgi:hypothetical protein